MSPSSSRCSRRGPRGQPQRTRSTNSRGPGRRRRPPDGRRSPSGDLGGPPTILPAAGPVSTRASTSTPGPASSTHGARMKTACTGSSRPSSVEVLLEGVDLAAERVAPHGDVEAADGLLAGRAVLDPVGQQDHPGARAEGRQPLGDPAPRSGSSRSKMRASLTIVVDSPPGRTRPSHGGELGGTSYGDRGHAAGGEGTRGARARRPGGRGRRSVWVHERGSYGPARSYPRPHEAHPRRRPRRAPSCCASRSPSAALPRSPSPVPGRRTVDGSAVDGWPTASVGLGLRRPGWRAWRAEAGDRARPASPWSASGRLARDWNWGLARDDAARGLLDHQVGHQHAGRHRGARRRPAPRATGSRATSRSGAARRRRR